ncbi:transcriptional protein SWT1 isoform X1 [Hydra vulgaris]|uniref:Transcriptional protein SWT1 n=1 Tax=Hydra vulgaris TaxID=6087 RepID=T2MBL9_HYDVU|nr:transcriptional protein SWT1 [Hydra vulgaris]
MAEEELDEEEPLPPGWIKSFSRKFNKHYYFNNQTNESVWEHPSKNNNEVKFVNQNQKPNQNKLESNIASKQVINNNDTVKLGGGLLNSNPVSKEKNIIKKGCIGLRNKNLNKNENDILHKHVISKVTNWKKNIEQTHESEGIVKNYLPVMKPVDISLAQSLDKSTPENKCLLKRKKSDSDHSYTSSNTLPYDSPTYPRESDLGSSRAGSVCSKRSVHSGLKINKMTSKNMKSTGSKKSFQEEKIPIKKTSLHNEKLTPAMKNIFKNAHKSNGDLGIIVPKSKYVAYKKNPELIKNLNEKVIPQSFVKDAAENYSSAIKPIKLDKSIEKNENINFVSSPDKLKGFANPFFENNCKINFNDEKPKENKSIFATTVTSFSNNTQNFSTIETKSQCDTFEPMQCEDGIFFNQLTGNVVSNENQDSIETLNKEAAEEKNRLSLNGFLLTKETDLLEDEMEIDDASDYKNKILKEIRGIREEKVVQKPQITDLGSALLPTYNEPLYIVVDTNILLAHLKFVSELKDFPFPGVGTPILIIPWMVLQELDSLKDAVNRTHTEENADAEVQKTKLNILARQAIHFLNKCFEGEHPRVKGESVIEAGLAIEGFTELTNDDSIIHCALALKKQANQSHTVMLSNDRNLCNKAMTMGIKSFSQQSIMPGLRSLFGTIVVKKENYKEFYEQRKIQEIVTRRKKQADEISCELQCILREALARVVETEMKAAYGDDLWLKIVKIQPPWTLNDLFILLERHWIAVFGMILKRSLEKNITNLKEMFQTLEGKAQDFESIKVLLNESLLIFEEFSNHSDYDEMLINALSAVHVLFGKYNDIIKHEYPVTPLYSPFHNGEIQSLGEISDGNMKEGLLAVKCKEGSVRCKELLSSSNLTVMQTFEAIWLTVKRFSALIFYSLDYPSPYLKELDSNEPKPSQKEALECLNTLTPCLLRLVMAIHNILLVNTDCTTSDTVVSNLQQSLNNFMIKVMKKKCSLTSEDLLKFCKESSTRSVLVKGLSQLDHAYALLQQCVDYRNG